MPEIKLGEIESRFADLIWTNEPLHSRELAKMAEAALGWKPSTSYTILKRLCDRGLFQNVKQTVTSLISKEEFYSMQSKKYVEDTFAGSLPAFIAAFISKKNITAEEADEIQKMIDAFKKEG